MFLLFCLKELQTAFNSNIKSRFDVQVAVNDFYAQRAFDVYRGFLQLFTIKRRQPRQCVLPSPGGLLDIALPSLLKQQVNNASSVLSLFPLIIVSECVGFNVLL